MLSVRNGPLRARLKIARAARHHELCMSPERVEYFLDSRQTNSRPASPSCGIDKDDCPIFAESTRGFGAIPHAPSLMLWRSEERRVGKSVDLGGRRIIKKKKGRTYDVKCNLMKKEYMRGIRRYEVLSMGGGGVLSE